MTSRPGAALRSSLYAALIRESLQPLPKRSDDETAPRGPGGGRVHSP
jgi:hypothetical protein